MTWPAPDTVTLTLPDDVDAPGVSVTLRRTYSLALALAGQPFVVAATGTTSGGDAPTLTLEGLHLHWPWLRGGTQMAGPTATAWHEALEGMAGARATGACLSLANRTARAEILLTDPWWWNWCRADLGALPALVLPHDGIVRQFALAARRRTADDAATPPEVLCSLLRDEYEVAWQPPALEHVAGGPRLQPIRPPHRVLFDLHQRRGEGTCIDLVLLLAGGLEASGQSPVLVVLPDEREQPAHALLGWWRDGAQRYRPLLTAEAMLTAWRRGEFTALETTRLCCDRAATLAEAVEQARVALESTPGSIGLDVRAARPPVGRVRPLGPLSDPAVLAALAAAEVAAHLAASTVIETLHVFCGLVGDPGPLGQRILAAAGVDADDLARDCRQEIDRRRRQDHVGRTRGVIRCLDDARHNARSQGVTAIRESDLWWAVLSLPGASLQELFERRSGLRTTLLAALGGVAPLPRHGSSLQ